MEITLTHVAVGMALSVVGSVSMLWATWVRPAHAKEVKLQVRLAQIEGRLDAGDEKFGVMDQMQRDMRKVLDRLTAIETILKERGGLPNQD